MSRCFPVKRTLTVLSVALQREDFIHELFVQNNNNTFLLPCEISPTLRQIFWPVKGHHITINPSYIFTLSTKKKGKYIFSSERDADNLILLYVLLFHPILLVMLFSDRQNSGSQQNPLHTIRQKAKTKKIAYELENT